MADAPPARDEARGAPARGLLRRRQGELVVAVDVLYVREVLDSDRDIAIGAGTVGPVAELAVEVVSPRAGPPVFQDGQGVTPASAQRCIVLPGTASPGNEEAGSSMLKALRDTTKHLRRRAGVRRLG